MNGKTIAVVIGAGVIGYVLYKEYQTQAAASDTPATPTPTPKTTATQESTPSPAPVPPSTPPPAPVPPTTPQTDSVALLAQMAQLTAGEPKVQGGKAIYDVWTWFYNNRTAYGAAHPAPGTETAGFVRGVSDTITLAEWWAAVKPFVSSSTLVGLPRRKRWGHVRGLGDDDGTTYTLPAGPALPDGSFTTSGQTREQVARQIFDETPVSTVSAEYLDSMGVDPTTGNFYASGKPASNITAWLSANQTTVFIAAGVLVALAMVSGGRR